MTTRLKTLFQRPALFVLAGGINPIGAKMAEALGYDAFYMSGGNTSAHQLGWPDSGTSMRDMVDNARKIVLTVQIPVFADADTGYGDAISAWRRSGAWALSRIVPNFRPQNRCTI
jgi:methylisocitrate lyase